MKSLFLLFAVLSFNVQAKKLTPVDVNIVGIDKGTEEYSLAYGSDGLVYKIPTDEAHILGEIHGLLDEETNTFKPLASNQAQGSQENLEEIVSDFTPTNLSSLEEAHDLFKKMYRRSKRRSQCYMRAHGWAYDLYRYYGINSEKIFVFFTRKYILNYDYKWWFHVAPMVTVAGEKIVMDREFFREPKTIKEWTRKFVYSKKDCPTVGSYQEYQALNKTTSEDCLFRITPMYFWDPRSIKNHDNGTKPRHTWKNGEIRASQKKAFRRFPQPI